MIWGCHLPETKSRLCPWCDRPSRVVYHSGGAKASRQSKSWHWILETWTRGSPHTRFELVLLKSKGLTTFTPQKQYGSRVELQTCHRSRQQSTSETAQGRMQDLGTDWGGGGGGSTNKVCIGTVTYFWAGRTCSTSAWNYPQEPRSSLLLTRPNLVLRVVVLVSVKLNTTSATHAVG